jgi:hypothetical protein
MLDYAPSNRDGRPLRPVLIVLLEPSTGTGPGHNETTFEKGLALASRCAQNLCQMARVRLPESIGELAIVVTLAGTPAVTNGRRGQNKIFVACRDMEHAKEVEQKIREAKPGTEVWL